MAHGGTRRPAAPAAVSGPGALSQRTDGGPANPIPPGGDYGDARDIQAITQAAQGAGQVGSPPAAPGPAPGGRPPAAPDVFAPTRDTRQPITAGVPVGDGDPGIHDDGLDLLRAVAQTFPNAHSLRIAEMQ